MESAIEYGLNKKLLTVDSTKDFFAFDSDESHSLFKKIAEQSEKLQMRQLITKSVKKIVISVNDVQIITDRKKLLTEICHALNLPMPVMTESNTATITIPIAMIKPNTGSFIIEPRIKTTLHDPLDRTPQELNNWVKGVIWRDKHFKGMTIRKIAREARCSDSRVAALITESFAAA